MIEIETGTVLHNNIFQTFHNNLFNYHNISRFNMYVLPKHIQIEHMARYKNAILSPEKVFRNPPV